MHSPCLEAGRIFTHKKKDRKEIAKGKRKNRSDAKWIAVEEDIFPFSTIV